MSKKLAYVTIEQVETAIHASFPLQYRGLKVWGVPRGGTHIALILARLGLAIAVDAPEYADVIVDDIIASGATARKWNANKLFWTPFAVDNQKEWLVFPWETEESTDGRDVVVRMLQHIGEDPSREGLIDTPKRVVKSWKELFGGYHMNPKDILGRVFSSDNNQMVVVKDINFYSMCEHHILPIIGKVHVAYIPNGQVVGLSKLARLVEVYARRLQIQEQFTQQIGSAMVEHIPGIQGAGVIVEATHLCMQARGVNKQGSSMVTSALYGNFKDAPVRAEFMSLIGK